MHLQLSHAASNHCVILLLIFYWSYLLCPHELLHSFFSLLSKSPPSPTSFISANDLYSIEIKLFSAVPITLPFLSLCLHSRCLSSLFPQFLSASVSGFISIWLHLYLSRPLFPVIISHSLLSSFLPPWDRLEFKSRLHPFLAIWLKVNHFTPETLSVLICKMETVISVSLDS